jgi:chemotaxis protein MotB
MARKKRGKPKSEEAGDAWLLPYSDLMTLLLALFISLFAISQTDQTKAKELAQAFSAAFNMGGPSFFDSMGPNAGRRAEMPSTEDHGNAAYLAENAQLEETKKQMDEYIEQNQLDDQISTELTEDGLLIRIKEQALFPSGSADLSAQAQNIGPVIAGLLAKIPERVIISGHTDNVPIHNSRYPSNWELSSSRALNFMKYLLSVNSSLAPQRFSAIGYAEYRPIGDNKTEEGRAKNRRVEVLIARSLRFNPNETNPNNNTGDSAPASTGGESPSVNTSVADGSHIQTTTF